MDVPAKWTIDDLLEASGGSLVAGPTTGGFDGISIDSRTIQKDQVFVAIKGARYDGHAFVPQLMDSGIKGIIVESPVPQRQKLVKWAQDGGCCILVADTTRALGDLAAFHRRRMGIPVVAITGSNGKTTTKEMAAAVVATERNTLATTGNLNNEIGLPLTLLRLDSSHETAVVELGMNHPGEIDRLGEISQPDVGVITNIGPAHLEGLKDTDHVMAAKAELLAHIRPEGSVLLNADDPYNARLRKMSRSRVMQFGFSENAGCRARNLRQQELATEFELVLPDAALPVRLPVPGRFMVANALAAAAVGHTLGIANAHIRAGLEGFRPVRGRMAHTLTPEGIHVVDDAYNANPGSMKAAVETLVGLKGDGRGLLIAGDMLELGPDAASFHYEAGRFAAARGVDGLYVSGDFAEDYVRGARAGGMDAACAVAASHEEILKQLRRALAPGDWVLVKGSHSTGMDRIVEHIIGRGTRSGGGRGA